MPRSTARRPAAGTPVRRPAALRAGDAVTLLAPSGPVRAPAVEQAVTILTSWGLDVRRDGDLHARRGFLAGTDRQRLAAVNAALADPDIRGLVCARGGYGVQRITDDIDMAAVCADPKLVVGFSDITALHLALWRGARLAGVHGPVATQLTEDLPAESVESMRRALMCVQPVTLRADPGAETGPLSVPGPAVTGPVLGGNLCLLQASVGTPDFPDLRGAVLLLEEVAEPPYKVDRMLTHLRRAGALAGLAGIAVGQFTRCEDGWPVSIVDVLADRLGDLGIPVLGGLPFGHGTGALSLPVGVSGTLDVAGGTLAVHPAVR